MLGKFWAWLLLSSKDPQKASSTIKALGAVAVTYVIFFTGLFHHPVALGDVTNAFDQVGNLVGLILMGISALMGTYAALRKLWFTLTGRNEVLNSGTTL